MVKPYRIKQCMSYKEVVLNYIKTHDVPCLLRGDIEDELWKCKSTMMCMS